MLDKLLANKPQDRYQNAGEAAEALQALVRPKKVANQTTSPPPPKKPAPEARPIEPAGVAPPPQPQAPPVVVTVRPTYPSWFLPLAQMAEKKPTAALLAGIGALLAASLAGFALGWFLKGG